LQASHHVGDNVIADQKPMQPLVLFDRHPGLIVRSALAWQRRLQAQAEGRPFMPYSAAKARLRKALVGVAAGETLR
jgi:hypothetical protein